MPAINRMLIEVCDTTVEKRKYTKADGSEGSYNVQLVYLHLPGKRYAKEFPRRVTDAPAALGWYEQDMAEMWVDYSFNRLQLTLGKLLPIPQNQVDAVLNSWKA